MYKCSRIFHALWKCAYFSQYEIVAGLSFWTSRFIHLTAVIQSDLQHIQGLLYISMHVSANRTCDLDISCTLSNVFGETIWSNWIECVNRKENAEGSHGHREVFTETVEVHDRRRQFRGENRRHVFLQERYDSFHTWHFSVNHWKIWVFICVLLMTFNHWHWCWEEFSILCNKD